MRLSIRTVALFGFNFLLANLTTASEGLATGALSNTHPASIVEIQQTIDLFAIAVDQHRLNLIPSIFTENVTANLAAPGATDLRGIQALTQVLSTLNGISSLHEQSTHYVTFSSTGMAHATTYNVATFFGTGDLQGQIFTEYGR